jgi:hypothetical protein
MARVVDVPLNTAIADLDSALRTMLRRELDRHGFEGVVIAFDAPAKEWSGKLTGPTVDLFLYDLREATDRSTTSSAQRFESGRMVNVPPPLQLELTYAITAWTKEVEDEHRLLSQVLAILYSYGEIPADVLNELPSSTVRRAETAVGRPREEKADFWTSVGGQYKASIDYVVHIEVQSGASFVRGPEVRTQTVRLRQSDSVNGSMEELHRLGGTVRAGDGTPLPHVWIALPEAGRWTASDERGRFRFGPLRAGRYRLLGRAVDGAEGDATVEVPGSTVDLVLSDATAGSGGTRRRR